MFLGWSLIALLALFIALLPTWPYSRGWSYWPSGAMFALLVAVFLLWLFSWMTAVATDPPEGALRPGQQALSAML